MLKQFIGIILHIHQHRRHTPGQAQLPADALIYGAAYDRAAGTVFGYHPGCPARGRYCNNGGSIQIHSRGTGGMGNGVGNIRIGQHISLLHPGCVVNVLFCTGGDLDHGFQCLHRILPGSRLPGKHDGAGSVIYGVRHVRRLCSGGSGMAHHGVQHLRRRDYLFSGIVNLFNDHLLDHGNILHRDLHTHIAPGNHNSIRHPDDFINIIYALLILNLGDQVNGPAPVLL